MSFGVAMSDGLTLWLQVDRKFFASAPVLSGMNKNGNLFLGIFHSLNWTSTQPFLILMIFLIYKQK